jgi:hypothetical protein
MKTIKCLNCNEQLKLSKFGKCKKNRSGYKDNCKICEKIKKTQENMLKKQKDNKQLFANMPYFNFNEHLIKDNKPINTSMIYVGVSRSGKSNNFLYNMKSILPHYDMRILITESTSLRIYHKSKFTLIASKKHYKKILTMIRFLQNKTKCVYRILLVLDDINKRNCPKLTQLYTNGRNINISVISLIQDPVMLNPTMRINAKYIFLFNQLNPESTQKIYKYFLKTFLPLTPKKLKNKNERESYIIKRFSDITKNYKPLVIDYSNGRTYYSTSEIF